MSLPKPKKKILPLTQADAVGEIPLGAVVAVRPDALEFDYQDKRFQLYRVKKNYARVRRDLPRCAIQGECLYDGSLVDWERDELLGLAPKQDVVEIMHTQSREMWGKNAVL